MLTTTTKEGVQKYLHFVHSAFEYLAILIQ